jgi:hypothetical protein
MLGRPDASAAATMARASSTEAPSGFSHNTGLAGGEGRPGDLAVVGLWRGNHHGFDGRIFDQIAFQSRCAGEAERLRGSAQPIAGWRRRSFPGVVCRRVSKHRADTRHGSSMGLAHIATTDNTNADFHVGSSRFVRHWLAFFCPVEKILQPVAKFGILTSRSGQWAKQCCLAAERQKQKRTQGEGP